MKIDNSVRVLTGEHYGRIGRVFDIANEGASYPITVEFPDGTLNAYYEEQLEILET